MTTAWVFPGQGSQTVGMGRDVYDRSPAARQIFEQADEVLGFALTELCFSGPIDLLTQTENAQPALLIVSAALLGMIEHADAHIPQPAFVAGHSLGEYTALYAAGALDLPTALRLVRRRGELMAAARNGTMAAVIGLDMPKLAAACAEASAIAPVVVANENAPGQLVISGAPEAVARAGELARAAGAKRVLPLQVSAAFHSPLMDHAARELAVAVEAAEIRPARIPVIGNVHARPLSQPADIRAELVAQVTAPVKWIATVEYMVAQGVDTFIEVGVGTVLTGLVKRIAPGVALRNVQDAAAVEQLLQAG